ncbi:MAG: membrane protein insertase YidC, partial [Lysobacterales bacterium]
MGNLRPVLLISLGLLAYMLWLEWQKDYGASPAPSPAGEMSQATVFTPQTVDVTAANQDLPEAPDPAKSTGAAGQPASSQADMHLESPTVTVTTDVLQLKISLQGGTVLSALLRDYPEELEEPQRKVNLLEANGERMFIAQSGLLSSQAAPNHTAVYTALQMEYRLAEGADEMSVPLNWRSDDGIKVTKTFVFRRGQYDIAVSHRLENGGDQPWVGNRYDQLQQAVSPEEQKPGFTNPGSYSFRGIAFYSPEEKFEKVKFEDVTDEPYARTFSGGWLAMIQHYFFAAWIPAADEQDN